MLHFEVFVAAAWTGLWGGGITLQPANSLQPLETYKRCACSFNEMCLKSPGHNIFHILHIMDVHKTAQFYWWAVWAGAEVLSLKQTSWSAFANIVVLKVSLQLYLLEVNSSFQCWYCFRHCENYCTCLLNSMVLVTDLSQSMCRNMIWELYFHNNILVYKRHSHFPVVFIILCLFILKPWNQSCDVETDTWQYQGILEAKISSKVRRGL